MKCYPVFLNIAGRRCVVVGGGTVAERKVLRLLTCGAQVTVVAPELTPGLDALWREGKIEVKKEPYHPSVLNGAFLVIGATDQRDINEQIYHDGRPKNVLVNIVDDPQRCDFILPSLLERGDLCIAISTAGKSPALARKIRQQLSKVVGPEYGILLQIMGIIRECYRQSEPDSQKRLKTYRRLLSTDILEEIRQRRWQKVEEIIKEQTGLNITFKGDERW